MYRMLYRRPFLYFSYVRGAKESRSSDARENMHLGGRRGEVYPYSLIPLLFGTSVFIPVTALVSLNHATPFLSMQQFSCVDLLKVLIRYKYNSSSSVDCTSYRSCRITKHINTCTIAHSFRTQGKVSGSTDSSPAAISSRAISAVYRLIRPLWYYVYVRKAKQ